MIRNSTIHELKKDMAAIIVAAGYSSRMKAFKPLLPFGESTVIEHALKTFIDAGITNLLVVLGHQGEAIEPLLEKHGVSWVYNEEYDRGMYSSIRTGVKALSPNSKGFFLLPADMPLVKSSTIEALLEACHQSGKSIIYPSHNRRKGHPPLISSRFYREIIAYDGRGGLKTLLKNFDQEHAEYVNVEDEGVVLDMDYYREYEKMQKKTKEENEGRNE